MSISEAHIQAGGELQRTYGGEIPNAEIKSRVVELCNCEEDSVMTTDYCYNSTNKGIEKNGVKRAPHDRPLYLKIRPGVFQFVGPDFHYDGEVGHNPRGTKGQ